MKGNVLFISGIDTNVGKTYATGAMAAALAAQGVRVTTQKMIQTGCRIESEDIAAHRRLQGTGPTDEDWAGWTCPYIFTYPCSPHMAAERDGKAIDTARITEATRLLCERYEVVLLEGAGGLMVPVDRTRTTIDYVCEQGYPVVLVTSGKLGSINHTLLSLAACRQYGLEIRAVIYNLYPEEDAAIAENTWEYLSAYLEKHHPHTAFVPLQACSPDNASDALPVEGWLR